MKYLMSEAEEGSFTAQKEEPEVEVPKNAPILAKGCSAWQVHTSYKSSIQTGLFSVMSLLQRHKLLQQPLLFL